MKIEIKKAKMNELREIVKIILTEFSKPPFNEKVNFNSAMDSLKFYFRLGEVYIAVINKKIVGMIAFKIEQYWEGKVLILEDLAVKEEFKRQGVGKGLMNFIESYAKKRDIKRVLFTTDKRSKAINFYKKLGYKKEKNRINMSKRIRK